VICLPLYCFGFSFSHRHRNHSPRHPLNLCPALHSLEPKFLLARVPPHPSLTLPTIHWSTFGYVYRHSIPAALRSIVLSAGGKLALSEFVWLRKTTRGLSKVKKRDAEKCKRQRKPRKAANHLHNSENGSEDSANSTMDAKGMLFSAI